MYQPSRIIERYSIYRLEKQCLSNFYIPQLISSLLSPQSSIPSHFECMGMHNCVLHLNSSTAHAVMWYRQTKIKSITTGNNHCEYMLCITTTICDIIRQLRLFVGDFQYLHRIRSAMKFSQHVLHNILHTSRVYGIRYKFCFEKLPTYSGLNV